MTEKLWSGRFREPLDPAFEDWQRSFPFDWRLIPDEIAASRAYAHALGKTGVLSADEVRNIERGLEQIAAKADDKSALEKPGIEDVHHFVEQALVEIIGDTGFKLHAGRSRNEQIATDLRLYTRRRIDTIASLLGAVCEALIEQAEGAGTAVMPSYTHLQRAEPVLVAHWLLAWVEMLLRDTDRLADCRQRVNVLPLGSGAVAGPGIVLDREAMARELKFDGISANSMDATSDRDFELEFLQVGSHIALHLSRWAEEMALFSTIEYGFVRLPEKYSTGSSAMPQKKNPDLLELVRGKAGRVIGAATTLTVTLKGLPLAYNKDMQEAQEPLFDAANTLVQMLGIVRGFVEAVEFDFERMRAAASAGYLNATAAARYLVSRGVPFRMAHSAVGQAVRLGDAVRQVQGEDRQ
ncbi:MAG TPA: argininosuccinate lyase, partial [Terriglobales bacterium]|nr:argininosuccinate lyase [Terriglobales bacterium]